MNFHVTKYVSSLGQYHLHDDDGKEWVYKPDAKAKNDNTTGFLRWPAEYIDLFHDWTGDYREQRRKLKQNARSAIKQYRVEQDLIKHGFDPVKASTTASTISKI